MPRPITVELHAEIGAAAPSGAVIEQLASAIAVLSGGAPVRRVTIDCRGVGEGYLDRLREALGPLADGIEFTPAPAR